MSNQPGFPGLRVAIAHYWFVSWRGGEKVVRTLLDMFPNADVYTLFLDEGIKQRHLEGHHVHTSRFDVPFVRRRHQAFFPLYERAVRSLKLRESYDLLITSESGPIKGIPNPHRIPHLCYIHSPMRYCWGHRDEYLSRLPSYIRPPLNVALDRLTSYDRTTIAAPGRYVANSANVRSRVQRYYGRDASIIHPPIELSLFKEGKASPLKLSERDYYVSFGALTPYKAIDLLIRAFRGTPRRLLVVGDGSERRRLEAMATANVQFLGALPDGDKLDEVLRGAKALLFPGEEDFGMVPIEMMARGVPVVAYGRGGALETVKIDGRPTGVLFAEQTEECLLDTLDRFESIQDDFDLESIRTHARTFGADTFRHKFEAEVANFLGIEGRESSWQDS